MLEFSPSRTDILSFHGVETSINDKTFNRLFKKGKEANLNLVAQLGDEYITYIIANALLDQEKGKLIVKDGLIINASKKSFRKDDFISFCEDSQNRLKEKSQENKKDKLKELRLNEEKKGFAQKQANKALELERIRYDKAYINENYSDLKRFFSKEIKQYGDSENILKMILPTLLDNYPNYSFNPKIVLGA